jgi:hypothetical protein
MKRLAALLLLVPVLAACGSSSKQNAASTTTTAGPSPAARAGVICRAYHAKLAQLGAPRTMQDVADYYGYVHTELGRMVVQLAALQPRTAAFDAFVDATRAELKPVAAIRAAALADDTTKLHKVAIQGELLDKKAHALAVKAKLGACAKTPASGSG